MVQRLALSLAAATVLGIGIGISPPLLAQDSERGPVGVGGRVEVPEAGLP